MLRPRPDVPGPFQWPLLGSFVPFARDPLGFVERTATEHGDVAFFRILEHDLWMFSHPDDIEQILVRDAKKLHKDAIYDLLRPMLGNGLVTAEDDVWKRHRKLAAPSFARRHVEQYADTMVACTRSWVDGLRDGQTLDVHQQMMHLTQRIVLDTLFGTDLDVDTTQVGDTIEVLMEDFVREAQGPGRLLPKAIPTPSRRRASAAIAQLDRTIYVLIEARRRKGLGDDLLSHLIQARDDDGGLSDAELRDEAITAFVAGHETTALALTWTWVLLGENPVELEPLLAEVRDVLGDRPATVADWPKLPRVQATLDEAMRLLPPVWAIGREAQQDMVIRQHAIPRGAQLLVSQWAVHHDPRWFPNPMAFDPSRWLDGLHDRLPRFAFFPFGGGPRVCIGQHFALMEAVLVLATILQRGVLRTTGPRPALMPSITLRPVGEVPATFS
ncbi:MAG: cytochrome P450 [Myxococcales bacterium]|nr:cytochrome P450 [Myxococcales bacterium]